MSLSNFFWIFLRTFVGVAKTAFYVTRTRRSIFFLGLCVNYYLTFGEELVAVFQKCINQSRRGIWELFCEKLKTLELRAKKFQTSGKKITTGLPNMPSTRQEEHLEDFCGENIVFFPIFDCEQEVLGLLLQVFCTFSDNFSAGLSNFHSTGPRKKSV